MRAASFKLAMSGCMVRKLKSVMRSISTCSRDGKNMYWRLQVEEQIAGDNADKMLVSNSLSIKPGHHNHAYQRRRI